MHYWHGGEDVGGEGKITLDFEISGKELFEQFQQSTYMKTQGYQILYATEKNKTRSITEVVEGFEVERQTEGDLLEYRLCFENTGSSKTKNWRYVHIHGIQPVEDASEFSYLITIGDEGTVLKDLGQALQEIKNNLDA